MSKIEINTEQEREVFRTFASAYPHEAADMNWPEFYLMVKEVNPEVTEDMVREMLKRMEEPCEN